MHGKMTLPRFSRKNVRLVLPFLFCIIQAEEHAVAAESATSSTAVEETGKLGSSQKKLRSRNLPPSQPKTPRRRAKRGHRRIEEKRERIERDRDDLKRKYFEFHGVELTDEMLDKAVAEARAKGPKRFEDGYKMRLTAKLPGFEEHREEHAVSRRTGRKLQFTIDTDQTGILVSALSPGWPWNYGRNEFYCAGFNEVAPPFLPKEGTKLTMLDCYQTPMQQIALWYTDDNEILFDEVDGIYWDWCVGTNSAKKGKLRSEKCDIQEPLQQWSLFSTGVEDGATGDGTWRPREDDFRCVTGKPPTAGKEGGGRLRIRSCASDGKVRKAQTWVWCQDTTNCDIDSEDPDFIDCVIEDDCENS